MTPSQAFVPAILEAHLDQGAFLWLQWFGDRFNETPAADLGESVRQRLVPHLEGCFLQAEAAWSLCQARCRLGLADAGEHFMGAALALHEAQVDWVRAVVAAIDDCQSLMAMRDAMAWLPVNQVRPWAERFAGADNPSLRLLGLAWKEGPALADGIEPTAAGMNAELQEFLCLAAPSEKTHAALASALAEMPPGPRYRIGRHLLGGSQARAATEALLPLTLTSSEYRDELIRRCFRNLDESTAKSWIQRLKTSPENLRATLLAVGALGEVALLPWVVQQLPKPELARVAGWTLEQLLDLNLVERGWVVREPAVDAPYMDDPRDMGRPWPDVQAITDYVYQERAAVQDRERAPEQAP